ncbi:MAG: LysM peptidoglycan-binding domain-containing protein [Akkermansiaceae bacterium]|jgi:LysM repeat protein|nr:LysM peptidoglycan-binding domain-containing protein [Akkermansiaceae bacterium]
MQRAFHLLSIGAALVALNACSSHSVHTEGALGPYDAQGNYIEAWADDPSKWRYPPGGSSASASKLPKDDVTPLWGRSEPAVILPSGGGSASKPTTQAARVTSAPTPPPPPRPSTRTTTSRPQTTAAKPTTTTRKPVAKPVAKPKPKPKPATPKVVTIQKGDSLSKLAARHGTTVSELKRANGLRGDLIIAGKTLKVPPKKR